MSSESGLLLCEGAWIDSDIAAEILWLNRNGVRTASSCSGHGQELPTALIAKGSSVKRAEKLGYMPTDYDGFHWQIILRGVPFVEREVSAQPYLNCRFSAGLVDGHHVDTIYLKFEREGEEMRTIYLRQDEAQAVLTVLSGALWSHILEMHIAHGLGTVEVIP